MEPSPGRGAVEHSSGERVGSWMSVRIRIIRMDAKRFRVFALLFRHEYFICSKSDWCAFLWNREKSFISSFSWFGLLARKRNNFAVVSFSLAAFSLVSHDPSEEKNICFKTFLWCLNSRVWASASSSSTLLSSSRCCCCCCSTICRLFCRCCWMKIDTLSLARLSTVQCSRLILLFCCCASSEHHHIVSLAIHTVAGDVLRMNEYDREEGKYFFLCEIKTFELCVLRRYESGVKWWGARDDLLIKSCWIFSNNSSMALACAHCEHESIK